MVMKVDTPTSKSGGHSLPVGGLGSNPQVVAYTTTTATSNAVAPNTGVVLLYLPEDSYVAVGTSPTATTSSMLFSAGMHWLRVGTADKIACLQTSAGGNFATCEVV